MRTDAEIISDLEEIQAAFKSLHQRFDMLAHGWKVDLERVRTRLDSLQLEMHSDA